MTAFQIGHKKKSLVVMMIRIMLLALLIYFLARNVNFSDFIRHLTPQLFMAFLLSQPLLILSVILIGCRFGLFLYRPFFYLPTIIANALALGLSCILPVRTWELIKPVYLRQKAEIPFSQGVSSLILEKVCDLIMVVIMSLMLLVTHFVESNWMIVIFSLLLMAFFIIIISESIHGLLLKLVPTERLKTFASQLIKNMNLFLKTKYCFIILPVSVIVWLCSYGAFAVFFSVAGITLSWQQVLLIFVATTFGNAIPVLPAAFGSYEAIASALLLHFGVPLEQSIATALVLHLSQIAATLLFSLSYVLLTQDKSLLQWRRWGSMNA